MELLSSDINKSILAISKYLVVKLVERDGLSENEALLKLITTATYQMLIDKDSCLFAKSCEYVYDMLDAELNGGSKS